MRRKYNKIFIEICEFQAEEILLTSALLTLTEEMELEGMDPDVVAEWDSM